MKKTSKFFSAFLALVMVLAVTAVPAFAASDTVDEYMDAVKNAGITLSNMPTAVGAMYSSGEFSRNVLIVPDGTIAYGNQSLYEAGRYYYTYWSDLPGSEVGGVVFTNWSDPYFEIENNLVYVLGLDAQFPVNEDGYTDLNNSYVDPGFSIVSQTTANRYAAGEGGSKTIVIRDSSGNTPTTPSAPSTPTTAKPAPGVSVPLNDGSGEFTYTIKSGDTLSGIAAYYYGNANVYKLIYERNKDTLKSANLIYAGQTIILPSYAAVAKGVAKI